MRSPRALTLCAALAASAAPSAARAGRPDTGGDLHDFALTDVVESLDSPSGRVRVHYSVRGPNATLEADADATGLPDLPEEVARTADAVLDAFEAGGFRLPVAESAVGLSDLGGSDAFDFYLVDFAGGADGSFSVDRCRGGICAGHMLVENDFRGYGYASVGAAVRTLASHEMFHAVQAAYTETLPVWLSEGTAVWAEDFFQPGIADFLGFADAYLEDASRAIDRPPVGPVPTFAYGTCLFWKFLSLRLSDALLPAILEASARAEGLDAVEAALAGFEGAPSLGEAFAEFTLANLDTGPRVSDAPFYPFADRLRGLSAKERGPAIHSDFRFYPLAAAYFVLVHAGGPVFFATADDPTGLVFSLHTLDPQGHLTGEALPIVPQAGAVVEVGDLPAGTYWLRGTYPQRAANSQKIAFCLGGAEALAPCELAPPDAGAPDAEAPLADAATGPDASVPDEAGGGGGGGCVQGRGRAPVGLLLPLALPWALSAARRRRRA